MRVFYVCYGSNMSEWRFREYLRDKDRPLTSYRVNLPRDVYYAGHNSRWGGGVAFLNVEKFTAKKIYRAYDLNLNEFENLFSRENGFVDGPMPWDTIFSQPITDVKGAYFYGRVVNLGTIDGTPALTFTSDDDYDTMLKYTSWISPPGQKYIDVMNNGRLETKRLPFKEIV